MSSTKKDKQTVKLEVSGDDLDLEKDDKYADRLDVIRHALAVHNKESKISEDYVLGFHNEAEQEFMEKTQMCAYQATLLIKDPEIAELMRQAMINEIVMMSVMRRNNAENPLIGKLLDPDDGGMEQKSSESLLDKVKGIFGGNKAQSEG